MVKCICIDISDKPEIIPNHMWPVLNKEYHITWIYYHTLQGVQGVELKEIAIEGCPPYESYRLTRFAFTKEGIEELMKLFKQCTDANAVDIDELFKELEVIEV